MNMETELNQALKKLRDIELALNESSIVVITDHEGTIQFVNDKFCEISKYSRQELIGKNQRILNSGYHSKAFFSDLWETVTNGNVWQGEIRNKAKDGSYYWVDTTIVPFLNDQAEPYQYIAIRHDITQRKQYEQHIEMIAYFDPLTSLPNRNYLNQWLSNIVNNRNDIVSLLFLDLDRFKSINDNFGHDTGDAMLKEVANRLKYCLRKNDIILRQGGDEFIVILHGRHTKEDTISVAEKILNQLAMPYHVNYHTITTSSSIGISMGRMHPEDLDCTSFIEKLIKQADTAMYHAKKQGGNTYCFNTPDQNQEIERYYQIEKEIKRALDHNEFSVVYQPLVRLDSSEIVGVEALLRWHNPRLGKVSPIEFIPVLEELGYILPVGQWVLRTVCNQMKRWKQCDINIDRVSVNVSPIQFRSQQFVRELKQILDETDLDPAYLELEITEGTILNIIESSKTLHELKELGVSVSIDDFGTGYSSLSYLKKLPIDTLKIDKAFINDLDVDGKIIVNTIINMGQNLNFTIIAEGIEKKEQFQYLQEQHCHQGQGYYWSKPVPGEEITALLDGTKESKTAY
ncbi:putative bifunctional diguanylate cyclase/phosphodiesterase [Aquibacillus sediminis]|uniref:putative bifunctional diguanylate cyclase/phosphodiesterase n=1 Tax=Aquibacillus sediminis TaxID=2574734 RepID=UPI001107BB07|nr:EAL domain-containing protein [Aquibacillus sediminis]